MSTELKIAKNNATADNRVTFIGKKNMYTPAIRRAKLNGCASCKELLEKGLSDGSGVYTLYPVWAIEGIETYCDMDTDGGGWTLVLGAGTYKSKTDPLWDGNVDVDELHYYEDIPFSLKNAASIIKNMEFDQIMIGQGESRYAFTSQAKSTFVDKRIGKTPWGNASDPVQPSLSWDYNDTTGYTRTNSVLGSRNTRASAYGDYYWIGLGVSPKSSTSLWTAMNYYNKPQVKVTWAQNFSISTVYHRGANENGLGLFFR